MAAPNIVAVTTIYGKTTGVAIGTGATDILENTAASGKVLKVNVLFISNVDGAASADVTVNFVDASPSQTRKIANTITVPADSTLPIIDKSTAIYLEEGDKLTALASASGDLEAVISWEEIG